MSISGMLPKIFVPTFEMKVNGAKLPLMIARNISQVSVTQDLDPPDKFNIQFNDPELTLIDPQTGVFTEGSLVKISMGYIGNTEEMITGEISALAVNLSNSGPTTVSADGFDLLHRLSRGVHYHTFAGQKPNSSIPDSDIALKFAAEMGLKSSVDPTPARNEPRTQNYETDLAFLKKIAQENGYSLWVEGDTLYFKSQRPAPNSVQLEWGKTLTSFSPRLSISGQVNTVEVRRPADSAKKPSLSGSAQRSSKAKSLLAPTGQKQLDRGSGGQSKLVIIRASVSSAAEAKTHAEEAMSQQEQDLISGSGTCVGYPDIRVGTELQLSGIGRFDGVYVVGQATHSIGGSGYQTSFQVNRKVK